MPSPWSDSYGVPPAPAHALESALAALAEPEQGGTETRLLVERFLERAREAGAPLDWLAEPLGVEALARLAYAAPFLVRHLTAFPQRLARGVLSGLEQEAPPAWADAKGSAFASLDEAAALAALRHWKYDRYVRLTARNLLGLADAAATCAAVSRVAEGVTRAALGWAFAEQVRKQGLPLRADGRVAGIAVVGMGKLGGGELNYSSDIDLILIHDGDEAECRPLPPRAEAVTAEDPTAEDADLWARWQALATRAGPADDHAISNGEFFQRAGRQVLRLLSAKTEEGLCFRADADLRPQGRSGLLVPSLAFTVRYYEEQGREWERTALLKARHIAGSPRVWTAFAEAIRPFVYRRYLDFSAMEGVALIKHDIDRHQGSERDGNLKLGRGGIRESEFLVQALQLLHGGRIPALQVPGHVAAVQALVEARLIEAEEADALLADYWLLRHVENRVQMLDEAQEHALPTDPALRRRVLTDFGSGSASGSAGRQDSAAAAIAQARARIEERYQRLFARLMPQDVAVAADWRTALAERLPPAELESARGQVDALLNRLMRTRPGERCVFKLERLLIRPELYAAGTEPAFPRWLALLEQIGNRNALYALLEAHPESLAWASRIFAEGGRHAPPLIRHPEFLESFLTVRPGEPRLTSGAAMRQRFGQILDHAQDEEEFLLDLQTANAHARLHILSQYLEQDRTDAAASAPQPAQRAAQHHALLSELADAAVDACARQAWRTLVPRYGLPQPAASAGGGQQPEAELAGFAVLALGKQGSRELRFGSDLDLVFVYRGEGTTSKGRSHLELYTKLAQKLTSLLAAPTQFGVLLELDHRLRPFGRKGLLVPSLAGYESFLAQAAEVWNFQSFTRARHLCGDPALSADLLGRVAREWMRRRTPPRDVAREVFTMAKRLAAQSPPSAPDKLQLKYALGGMLGFEFLRQCHFLLSRQSAPGADQAPAPPEDERAPAATWATLAAGWTPPEDHESIARLMPDYEALSALDERVSFYVDPYRHEVDADTFRRFAAVARRWSYEQVHALCERMQAGIETAFRQLSS